MDGEVENRQEVLRAKKNKDEKGEVKYVDKYAAPKGLYQMTYLATTLLSTEHRPCQNCRSRSISSSKNNKSPF